jgi:mRNA interferase MazF
MAAILRGAIHWADLNPVKGHEQAGTRPVLVLSHDVFNERSGTVIAMAITSKEQGAGFPLAYELGDRVHARRAWVKISQVRTLARERIGRRIGQVPAEELAEIIEGLNEIISG